ncbi:hypothetical protein T484DRAFT_1752372 [Baffinella frigidus]|nr:hypothetical protein T484DRAFT_1752372 [Cryptophyta sp. CCMP2293]
MDSVLGTDDAPPKCVSNFPTDENNGGAFDETAWQHAETRADLVAKAQVMQPAARRPMADFELIPKGSAWGGGGDSPMGRGVPLSAHARNIGMGIGMNPHENGFARSQHAGMAAHDFHGGYTPLQHPGDYFNLGGASALEDEEEPLHKASPPYQPPARPPASPPAAAQQLKTACDCSFPPQKVLPCLVCGFRLLSDAASPLLEVQRRI